MTHKLNHILFDRHTWGALRAARGITHEELAAQCGVSVKSTEKWFSLGEDRRTPNLRHTLLLAKALRIDLSKALDGITDPEVREVLRYALNND